MGVSPPEGSEESDIGGFEVLVVVGAAEGWDCGWGWRAAFSASRTETRSRSSESGALSVSDIDVCLSRSLLLDRDWKLPN